MLDAIDKKLLAEVADLHEMPHGAFNIRKNGRGVERNTTANIDIITKKDKPGIDVIIKPGTKGELVPFSDLSVTGGNVNVYEAIKLASKTKGKKKIKSMDM